MAAFVLCLGCSENKTNSTPDATVADATPIDAVPIDACVPALTEICGNNADDTCEGEIDEGCAVGGSLVWAKGAGGELEADKATAVAVAESGDVFTALSHNGFVVFGDDEPNETTITAPHPFQRFISIGRYSAEGELLHAWPAVMGTSVTDAVSAPAIASTGDSVIVAGNFGRSLTLAPDSPDSVVTLDSGGAYIEKFSHSGVLEWAQYINGGVDRLTSMVVFDDGRVAVLCLSSGPIRISPDSDNEVVLPVKVGDIHSFIAWYSADGVIENVTSIPYWSDNAYLATANDRVYMAMQSRAIAIHGPGASLATPALGVALVELSRTGDPIRTFMLQTGQGNVRLRGLAASELGFHIVGELSGSSIFGSGATRLILEPTDNGMFVTSYDPSGVLLWFRKTGLFNEILPTDIVSDPLLPGGVSVVGQISETTTFGLDETGATEMDPMGQAIFVARYQPTGDLDWVQSAETPERTNTAYSAVANELGQIVVGGVFQRIAIFGENETNRTRLGATGDGDGFTAVFAP